MLRSGLDQEWPFVCLDSTLIGSTRSSAPSEAGHDLWYSGKHKQHGGNIQVLTGPTGYPEWVSEVEPGSTHDITAARVHALPALYAAAAGGPPTLTDKGYTGATPEPESASWSRPRATTSPSTTGPATP